MPARSESSNDKTLTRPATVRAALLTVQLLFGVNYLVSKVIVTEIPPAAWAVLRSTSAFIVLMVIALAGRRRLPRGRDIVVLAIAGQFGVVLNQALFLEGLARTTVGRSSLLCAQIPTFVLVFSILSRQERLTPRKALSFLAGLLGVAVLLEADRYRWDAATLTGDLLTLANAASFAAFVVISRRVMARNDPLAATAVVFCFGALGMAAWGARALPRIDTAAVDGPMLAAMAFAVLGATVATYFLNLWAVKRVVATRVALYIFLQPVVAATLGVVLRGEAVTERFLVATLLVFVALSLRDAPPRTTPDPR